MSLEENGASVLPQGRSGRVVSAKGRPEGYKVRLPRPQFGFHRDGLRQSGRALMGRMWIVRRFAGRTEAISASLPCWTAATTRLNRAFWWAKKRAVRVDFCQFCHMLDAVWLRRVTKWCGASGAKGHVSARKRYVPLLLLTGSQSDTMKLSGRARQWFWTSRNVVRGQ